MKPIPIPPLCADAVVRFWDVDPLVYQTERAHVRRSHLELLLDSSARYEHHVVRGVPIPETKALRLGRALHVAVLQPDLAALLLAVAPVLKLRTNAGKDALARWRASLPTGAIELTRDEFTSVERMATALRSDPKTAPLLERDGATELPLEWEDRATGLPCKVMLDKFFETRAGDAVRVLDLKSSNDPTESGFARSCATFGYHRQDAMYRDAAQRYAGGRPIRFLFLVVRSEPPFECALYELDDVAVEVGRRQIRRALDRLAKHLESGDWRAPWQGPADNLQPTTISLPGYALKDAL